MKRSELIYTSWG
ncbi:tonB-dependent Receptor Plug domain protein, partial [Yersinia pestis PY-42]